MTSAGMVASGARMRAVRSTFTNVILAQAGIYASLI
jgi:hypothetical protein